MNIRPDIIEAAYGATLAFASHAVGQDHHVTIGRCIYGRYSGVYVYKVYGELNGMGLQEDGTWHKYGHNFGTIEAAFDALMATDCTEWVSPGSAVG